MGQVESLQPGKNALIVLLCGETNPSLATRFRQKYKLTEEFIHYAGFTLVVKETATAPTKPEKARRKS